MSGDIFSRPLLYYLTAIRSDIVILNNSDHHDSYTRLSDYNNFLERDRTVWGAQWEPMPLDWAHVKRIFHATDSTDSLKLMRAQVFDDEPIGGSFSACYDK